MGRVRHRMPSAAMVVAIIALIFAVAGTAVGGVATISALSKKEKKQTRNIADSEIAKKAPGLSVANAVNAQNAANLGGQPASSYAPATTLRTATVAADGTVDAAHSDGVSQANVTDPVPGIYCFNGLGPAPRSVVASHAGGTADIFVQIQYDPPSGACAGSQFDIATLTGANALDPEPFSVFIH
jgi:hypothetical protein